MALTPISPEGFDIANAYIQLGSVKAVSEATGIPEHTISQTLSESQVKRYLDGVYLDMGYRNRNKLGALLDKMIDKKIEEAEESDVWTSKDLFDLLTLAHKMRMDEIKAEKQEGTTVNVAQFGGNYNSLMERLLKDKK